MLEVRSVSKHFGGAQVVSDVSLKVGEGGIVGLIGPNGAGKTTLFNLIAGSLKPSQGEIHLAGTEITREGAHRRLARGLGRTFQIPRPFAEMTLIENMLAAAQAQSGERLFANWLTPGRVAREERANAEKAMAHLEFLGLARLAREPARVLSGGQRKLLELGRVLMADPRIILKKALEENAVNIILGHNHPSGNLRPSKADEELTHKIKEGARYLDIKLLDHIIVSEQGYFSFADQGLL